MSRSNRCIKGACVVKCLPESMHVWAYGPAVVTKGKGLRPPSINHGRSPHRKRGGRSFKLGVDEALHEASRAAPILLSAIGHRPATGYLTGYSIDPQSHHHPHPYRRDRQARLRMEDRDRGAPPMRFTPVNHRPPADSEEGAVAGCSVHMRRGQRGRC